MIVHFNPEEKAAIEALEAEYEARKKALESEEERLAPDNCPDTRDYFNGIDPEKNPDEWQAANNAFMDAMTAWVESGSEEWKSIREQRTKLTSWIIEQRRSLFNKAADRQFSELKGDTIAIIDDFRKQVVLILQSIYDEEKEGDKRPYQSRSSIYLVSLGGGRWKLYPDEVKKAIKSGLHWHYEALSHDPSIIAGFDRFIDETLQKTDYVAKPGEGEPFGQIKKQQQTKYRTRDIARAIGAIVDPPSSLAIPTLYGYQYATSLYTQGEAFVQPLASADGLRFKDGKIYFIGQIQPLTEMEVQNLITKEKIESISTGNLRTFYSIILTQFQTGGNRPIEEIISIRVSALAMIFGKTYNLSQRTAKELQDIISYYHNMVGVLYVTVNGKKRASYYPVLNFEGYDAESDTISFSSPYMNKVIQTVFNVGIVKNSKGEPQLKRNGEPRRIATHSYLIKPSLQAQRNDAAADNVQIIVALIEQAGDNTPNIKASTIIERNPQFAARLEAAQNKRRLLQTTFKATWEYLREHTLLQETYTDIQLPNPENPAFIPTVRTLKSMVFTFPHNGKKEKK